MPANRLEHISPIGVEQMGALADSLQDPEILRLENLDTDLRPPAEAIAFTRQAILEDHSNSYLPFLGQEQLRRVAAEHVGKIAGQSYDWQSECIISAGGLAGITNVLLATVNPGDEVLLTSPIYVGLINRVRLAGGVPRFVPLIPGEGGWRLDLDALQRMDLRKIKVFLIMSPSMPTGAVLDFEEWEALTLACRNADALMLYDAAMERILFDGRAPLHPARFSGMRDRVVTVGSASKEQRMIGWRVGWVVGSGEWMRDIARVSLANVVCQTGIGMGAAAMALREGASEFQACVTIWEARRDCILEELQGYPIIRAHGGWSMLLELSPWGIDAAQAAEKLLARGKIAATPMRNWGPGNENWLRLVYSNEPVERLKGIRERFERALGKI